MDKLKRKIIQILFAFMQNPFIFNFLSGNIYRGELKIVCAPGLNCYSCPSSAFACPIGALQTFGGDKKYKISFYVLGMLFLFSISLGRFICGFICPFGLFQDLLYKIKSKKIIESEKYHFLKYTKYLILFFIVFLASTFIVDAYEYADPYFCKFICPSGTIFAGIPLILKNEDLSSLVGNLFYFKLSIAFIITLFCIFLYRFFCKYLCPLGAIYAMFNKYSFLNLHVSEKCISCKKCSSICKMKVSPYKSHHMSECIRCYECVSECPTKAIHIGFKEKKE